MGALALGLLVVAYAIAIAASAGALPRISIDPIRVFSGGLAIALSAPLVGFAVWVAIRWKYFNGAWRSADGGARIAVLGLLVAEGAAAAAGWIAFLFVLHSPG